MKKLRMTVPGKPGKKVAMLQGAAMLTSMAAASRPQPGRFQIALIPSGPDTKIATAKKGANRKIRLAEALAFEDQNKARWERAQDKRERKAKKRAADQEKIDAGRS